MEHRASVLSYSLKRLEKFHHPAQSPKVNGTFSHTATSSPTDPKALPIHAKFEDFFAGHSDTIAPEPPKRPPSNEDLAALEEKLNVVTRELTEANKQQADLARDLSLLKLEKEQLQTTLELELQTAEEKTRSLGNEIAREAEELRRQRGITDSLRAVLGEKEGQLESLQKQLEAAKKWNGEASEANKQVLLKEQELTELKAEMDAALRAKDIKLTEANTHFELERGRLLAPTEEGSASLWAVVQEHDIPLPADSDTTIPILAESISFFIENTLDSVHDSIREQRELSNAVRESRAEAEALRKEVQYLESQSRVCHFIPTNLLTCSTGRVGTIR